ncbi:hypothetical protein GIB67_020567 [Kingdonia uniflora]|uniref:Apple domain-containing protein n=1 Tax=Kingdonia uniflora TaxID=39325 RepID=A0A7J7NLC4_9MAGN|nr:hypothetical protein GIB67_020567 [Kingdonia uniflora]
MVKSGQCSPAVFLSFAVFQSLMVELYIYISEIVNEFQEISDVYFTFENIDKSTISRFAVNESGSLDYLTWNGKQRGWNCIVTMMKDICDNYAECGAYGVCTMNGSLGCKCMKKFTPRSPQDWHNFDPSAGCVRNSPLNCSHGEGFIKLKGLKLPDSPNILLNESMKSAKECKMECLANCSCMAYAATKMSGCITWFRGSD